MQYARDEKDPELKIKKFERTETPIRGILKVDKKAGDPFTMEDIAPYPYPRANKVVDEIIKNWFPNVEPIASVPRPLGYIIPAKHKDVVETMLNHGLKIEAFTKDMSLEVEAYSAVEIVPSRYDYLPPQKIDVEKKTLQIIVKER